MPLILKKKPIPVTLSVIPCVQIITLQIKGEGITRCSIGTLTVTGLEKFPEKS